MNDNEARLFALLRSRYKAPEWCLLNQVRNGTGYVKARTRTADAIAMNTYPSRGLAVLGFEFKAARYDWLNELKNPGKAEDIALMCDYWWVVADRDVVADGELPHGWGLLEAKGKRLYVKAEAACMCELGMLRERLMDRAFVAAILRRVLETDSDEALVRAAEVKGRAAGYAEGKEHQASMMGSDSRKLVELQKAVDEFTQASGVELDQWRGGGIGEAVRVVMSLRATGYGGVLGTMKRLREDLVTEAEHIGKLEEELSGAVAP